MNMLFAFMALVALTNMATNLVKEWPLPRAVEPRVAALVIAELLTVGSAAAWFQCALAETAWYHYAGAAVAGMVVAYVAMYGYDSLYEDLVKYLRGLKGDK